MFNKEMRAIGALVLAVGTITGCADTDETPNEASEAASVEAADRPLSAEQLKALGKDSTCIAVPSADGHGFWCGHPLEEADVRKVLMAAETPPPEHRAFSLAAWIASKPDKFTEDEVEAMLCIAKNESGHFTDVGKKTERRVMYDRAIRAHFKVARDGSEYLSVDRGIFQINNVTNAEICKMTDAELFDPKKNALCALKIQRKQGFWAWHGYSSCAPSK